MTETGKPRTAAKPRTATGQRTTTKPNPAAKPGSADKPRPADKPGPGGKPASTDRSSATDRPRRSDVTRAAILSAARERFATDGYERATIRTIAADANIDPAMVMRYYGSKERLFAAAAEFDLRLPDLHAVAPRAVSEVLVRHFLERWESDETLTALLRAGATNEAAAERMRSIFATQLGPAFAAVCPDRAEVPVRAALVSSQILGLALVRYVLRLPPVVEMSHDEVVSWLAPTLRRYLTGAH